jgi:hypothetical protein
MNQLQPIIDYFTQHPGTLAVVFVVLVVLILL